MNLKNKINGLREILKFDNWFANILKTLFQPQSQLFIYKLNGKEFLINKKAGDVPGFRSIVASNEYKPFLIKIKSLNNISVIDLGANVGGFICLLDSMKIKIKKLIAVEYNINTFYRLGINITTNFNFESYLINKAVVGFERDIIKKINLGGTGDSIFATDNEVIGNKQTIQGITIDKIFNQYCIADEIIDLIKIDIEGAEYEIFEHTNYQKLKQCRYIIIEIHNVHNKSKETVFDKLKEIKFEECSLNLSKNKNVYFFKNLNLI